VRALRLLAILQPDAIKQVNLGKLSFLASESNPQGLPAMLQEIRSQSDRWQKLLSPVELSQIDTLLELLGKARTAEADAERDAVIVAEIDSGKLTEFKTSLMEAFESSGRLRPLMHKLGILKDYTHEVSDREILSWGFNQLDDKGAFIVQSRVSYGNWGESYGRGLAQTEDEIAFETMTESAAVHDQVRKTDIITILERHLARTELKNPIVVQSLTAVLEFESLDRSSLYIPKYRKECPSTPFNDLEGFMGILKLHGHVVPVFDLFVQREDLRNKVLLADLPRFARWEQFSPVDEDGDEPHRVGVLMVRVVDLNRDDDRRERIIRDEPHWLQEQSDPDKFLRSRVVVNVFEKFKVEIMDRAAGISITVATGET
jgi:hypothetical protein